jgi:hypothetical protein
MKVRCLVSAAALAVVVALASPAVLHVSAQGRGGAGQAPAAPASGPRVVTRFAPYIPPQSNYVPPKTSWGDPDISGVYDFQTIIRMQRPPALAGKKTFANDQELEEYAKGNTPNEDACGTGSRAGENCSAEEDASVGDYNDFWNNRNFIRDYRTALIEDPDDGRIPPMTPEAQKAFDARIAARRARGPLDSWEDFSTVTRCIAEQTPNGNQMYNSGTLVMQSPGWVMLIRERLDTRFIPLDGRPHVDENIRLWHGSSVGRWEGNTLVVDTTNFTDKQIMGGVGSTIPAGIPLGNMHLVERWVPVAPGRLNYYATIEDPKTWVRPWTFMLPWQKDDTYTIYEYACHEADISIESALRGERMLEAQRAEIAKTGFRPDHTNSLIGKTEAEIRAMFGEPLSIVNTRWSYETTGRNVLYLFFEMGKVKIVAPNDLLVSDVRKR